MQSQGFSMTHEKPGERSRSPNVKRLKLQVRFILECDKLKRVKRRTRLLDRSRRENSAEHSWHLALMALLLSEHASPAKLDLPKVIQMLLIHDLVEIEVGDLFLYDESIQREKAVQERRAAANFFSMLPSDQCRKLQSLWEEFETRRTPEARFAAALDRFQPLLHNYYTEGAAWRRHGVTSNQVLQVNRRISEGSPVIWEFARKLIHDSIRKGYLPEPKGK